MVSGMFTKWSINQLFKTDMRKFPSTWIELEKKKNLPEGGNPGPEN